MKFSEVPIGAKFKTKLETTAIKFNNNTDEIPNVLGVGSYKLWSIHPDDEVELITKCENCKWYDRNWKNLECETDDDRDDHCHKLGIHICGDEYYCLNVDKETFSCSLFEMKTE